MPKHHIFTTSFAAVYPLYVQKAERKNRTKEDVDQIICWLTGYDAAGLQQQIAQETDFATFFAHAPAMHPNRSLITGVVCGVRVEAIEDPLMQNIRYLDKLIDELAKGKALEKICGKSALLPRQLRRMDTMMQEPRHETWALGSPYEHYVGRWSRIVAREFLTWLAVPPHQTWADVGCGTGAVVAGILRQCAPRTILAIDRSAGFLADAQRAIQDGSVHFAQAEATALPWRSASCAATVSGLVLNFVPDPVAMLTEMRRVTRPGGTVAAYVWDYSGGMEMMRHFWDAAIAVNPKDAALDQAERFPLCQPEPLTTVFRAAGLTAVDVRAIEIPTIFHSFDDYWLPFLGKQGAAPTYLASLDQEQTERIRAALQARLVAAADGSIRLTARAWAVQGTV